MRKSEREALLNRARNERTRKKGVRKLQGTAAERATAGEFGAGMSPSMTDREKAVASKRGNIRDIRYTGTDAKNKVFKASQKKKTDDKRAAATRTAVKSMPKKATSGTAKKDGIKEPTKKFNVGVSKGGVSFREAFKHFRGLGQSTFTWNGKKYTTNIKKAKPTAKISTPTPADFTATGPKKSEQKAKPKTKKKPSNAPNVGLGKMKTFGGLPVGALRKFNSKTGYNSKKERLKKVGNTTYVFKKGK